MIAARHGAAASAALAIPAVPREEGSSHWQDALIAAQLFVVDPSGLGGIAVLAGPGLARELWFDVVKSMLATDAPVRRLPAGIGDDRLLGGVDLIATLKTGRPVLQRGVLAEASGGIIVVPMAERLGPGITARIGAALDRRELSIEREGMTGRVSTRIGVVAFDEGGSAQERVPTTLLTRLAFHIDLRNINMREVAQPSLDGAATAAARTRLGAVAPASDEVIEALVATGAAYGIESVRAPLLALRAARAAAALAGRQYIETDDAVLAARLVLGPRACIRPADDTEQSGEDDQGERSAASPDTSTEDSTAPHDREGMAPDQSSEAPSLEDIMRAAVQVALPEGLLAAATADATARGPASRGHGAGAAQASLLRGRPAGVGIGPMRPGVRLALVDTLRAAAPWQGVRRAEALLRGDGRRISLRREDFRIKRFAQRRESTIVFCVDASGSAAFHRLAEAKGAVELLLGQAYAARTYAALVVFRGKRAELLLPPTRSLSRAKTLLANLPGGGGTPLASGIDMAVLTAVSERAKGRDPLVVILTDGRANIARDGLAARPGAFIDALAAARQLQIQRIAAVLVDTSPRGHGGAADLAAAMNARYVALPYVDATAVRDIVRAASMGSDVDAPRAR
jgi:magnesium chelatase subunit D